MFGDLIKDFMEPKEYLPSYKEQIDEVLKYIQECGKHVHTYLKCYGD
jgi:hypothetical protein